MLALVAVALASLPLPFELKHDWSADLAKLPRGTLQNDAALVRLLGVELTARQTLAVEGEFTLEGTRTLLVRVEDTTTVGFLSRYLVRVDAKGLPVSSAPFGTWSIYERSTVTIDAAGNVNVFTERRSLLEKWTRALGEFTAKGKLTPQLQVAWLPHDRACFRNPRSFEDLCIEHDGPRTLLWYAFKGDSQRDAIQSLAIVGEPTRKRIDFHYAKDTRPWTIELADDEKSLTVGAPGAGAQRYDARLLGFDEAKWSEPEVSLRR
ncbi:MAG: hypothetical protein QM817_35435 [Archangium sp.]